MSTPYNPNHTPDPDAYPSHNGEEHTSAAGALGDAENTGQYPQYQVGQQYGQAGDQQFGQSQFGVGQPVKQSKDGFFAALFDLSFSRFVTVDFVRLIYTILLAVIGLFWVGGLLFALAGFSDGFGSGLLMLLGHLVFGTLGAFVAVVIARISLEFYVSLVKTAQNTSKLVELEERVSR